MVVDLSGPLPSASSVTMIFRIVNCPIPLDSQFPTASSCGDDDSDRHQAASAWLINIIWIKYVHDRVHLWASLSTHVIVISLQTFSFPAMKPKHPKSPIRPGFTSDTPYSLAEQCPAFNASRAIYPWEFGPWMLSKTNT